MRLSALPVVSRGRLSALTSSLSSPDEEQPGPGQEPRSRRRLCRPAGAPDGGQHLLQGHLECHRVQKQPERLPQPGQGDATSSEPAAASSETSSVTVCSFSRLQAFSAGTSSDYDRSLKEKAPFTIRNCLGIPLIVQHGANLRPKASTAQGKLHELPVGHSLDLEHSTAELSTRGKLSALQRQESCLFNLSIGQSASVMGPRPRPQSRLHHRLCLHSPPLSRLNCHLHLHCRSSASCSSSSYFNLISSCSSSSTSPHSPSA